MLDRILADDRPQVTLLHRSRHRPAEIRAYHRVVPQQLRPGPLERDPSRFHHVSVVADGERLARILLDQQDRVALGLSSATMRKMSRTSCGARPIDGSSSRKSFGRASSPRAMASICCSPPESDPAECRAARARIGNRCEHPPMSRARYLRGHADRRPPVPGSPAPSSSPGSRAPPAPAPRPSSTIVVRRPAASCPARRSVTLPAARPQQSARSPPGSSSFPRRSPRPASRCSPPAPAKETPLDRFNLARRRRGDRLLRASAWLTRLSLPEVRRDHLACPR